MKVLYLLTIFSLGSGFLSVQKAARPVRNLSSLKAVTTPFNPFNFDTEIGETILYSDMFKDETLKNIKSVAILQDGKTAYALDKIEETKELTTHNIHKIDLNPQSVGDMVETLVIYN